MNGISLQNVDYATAVQVLRDSGDTVNLIVKRRIPQYQHSHSASYTGSPLTALNINPLPAKVTLTKNSKKEGNHFFTYNNNNNNRAINNLKHFFFRFRYRVRMQIVHKGDIPESEGSTIKYESSIDRRRLHNKIKQYQLQRHNDTERSKKTYR